MIALHLSHRENEKCGFPKYVKVMSKLKLKNKSSSNENFISEVHWDFSYIYIYNFYDFKMTWLL